MKALFTAIRIWALTILLNACLFGCIHMFMGHWMEMWGTLFIFCGGYVTTLPLLLLIVPLVELAARLPYGHAARTAWLFFYLVLLVLLFYWFLDKVISFYNGIVTGTTIAGLSISVWCCSKRLKNLYQLQSHKNQTI